MTKRNSDPVEVSESLPSAVASSSSAEAHVDRSVVLGLDGANAPVKPVVPFPIVGVGASAGGLEALALLLRALPADTGASFVIVQHLAHDHASNLAEFLSRSVHAMSQSSMRIWPV